MALTVFQVLDKYFHSHESTLKMVDICAKRFHVIIQPALCCLFVKCIF